MNIFELMFGILKIINGFVMTPDMIVNDYEKLFAIKWIYFDIFKSWKSQTS